MESAVANLFDVCPTCGTELARAKYLEVQKKLSEQEAEKEAFEKRAMADAQKEALRVLTEEKRRVAEEQAAAAEKATAEKEALRKKNEEQREALEVARKAVQKANADKDVLEKNAKEQTEAAVAAAQKKFEAEAAKKAASEREAFEGKVKAEREALKKKNEEQLETLRNALEKAKADKEALERYAKEAQKQAVSEAVQKKEREMAKKAELDLAGARAALKAEHDKQMLKQVAEANRDKEAALKKTKELERKLEAKTANSLGDGAEIDIYEDLKEAFEGKGDKIKRVLKGQSGPDIVHEVTSKGAPCGKIVLDSKNRQGWQNSYTSKLHDDMVEAKADYAILPSVVFPQGKRELWIQDGVIVVSPARVVELVRILRNALIRFHQITKSNEERSEKKSKLYDFINSEQFKQKFGDAGKLTDDLSEIDAKEHDAHTKVWEKRHEVVKKMKAVLGDIDDGISAIVHGG